jgi:Ca-activated chloride channel homolog
VLNLLTRRVTTTMLVLGLALLPGSIPAQTASSTASSETPVFRSGVDRVTVFATVRDRRGRIVPDLTRVDFELLDSGVRRPIVDFRAGRARVSVALLADVSGSMAIGSKMEQLKLVIRDILAGLEPGSDEAALYAFDTQLQELQPLTTATDRMQGAYQDTEAFGATSLWDAAASAARRLAERGGRRRALVVLTDGVDTSSQASVGDAAALASSFDIPVYIVAVNPPVNPGVRQNLSDLARLTGGSLSILSSPAAATAQASAILGELRHQYFMAFETSGEPGWHPLVLKTRNRSFDIRARSGYYVTSQAVDN